MTKYHNGTVTWQEYVDQGGDPKSVDVGLWTDYPGGDKQTAITQYGDSRRLWEVATTDPYLVNRLLKRKHIPLNKSCINGVFYFVLLKSNLSIRSHDGTPVVDEEPVEPIATEDMADESLVQFLKESYDVESRETMMWVHENMCEVHTTDFRQAHRIERGGFTGSLENNNAVYKLPKQWALRRSFTHSQEQRVLDNIHAKLNPV